APAMITLNPASAAPRPNSNIRSGVRWAETIRASYSTPSSSSTLAAHCMVGQSDWLPMTMATGAPISAVLQVVTLARRHRVVELVDDRLAGGNLEAGDLLVGDVRQVLHQCTQRIAVGGDDHRLAAGQDRENVALPVGQHAFDRQLEAFCQRNGKAGIARVLTEIEFAAGLEFRRRHVEAAAPDVHLLVAVLRRSLGLVEAGQPAVVPLVQAPVLGLGNP